MADKKLLVGDYDMGTGLPIHDPWTTGDFVKDPDGNPLGTQVKVSEVSDGPGAYTDNKGKLLSVKSTEDGVEFFPSSFTSKKNNILIVNPGETSFELLDDVPKSHSFVVASEDAGATVLSCSNASFLHKNHATPGQPPINDGLANAMAAAIAAGGGVVFIKEGYYETNTDGFAFSNNLVARGEGYGTHIKPVKQNMSAPLFQLASRCKLEDMRITPLNNPTVVTSTIAFNGDFSHIKDVDTYFNGVAGTHTCLLSCFGSSCKIIRGSLSSDKLRALYCSGLNLKLYSTILSCVGNIANVSLIEADDGSDYIEFNECSLVNNPVTASTPVVVIRVNNVPEIRISGGSLQSNSNDAKLVEFATDPTDKHMFNRVKFLATGVPVAAGDVTAIKFMAGQTHNVINGCYFYLPGVTANKYGIDAPAGVTGIISGCSFDTEGASTWLNVGTNMKYQTAALDNYNYIA